MILYEIFNTEDHPVYRDMEIANGNRQYDFLASLVDTSFKVGKPFLSSYLIKALNYQAISCLHVNAGEYRPCPVWVQTKNPDGTFTVLHTPPEQYRVQALMDDFVNDVNRSFEKADPIKLAAYVLWRLNWIHPFINGNGRTARAASYFVLCLKYGGWLPGTTILPELLRKNRDKYVVALRAADDSLKAGQLDLTPLQLLIAELIGEQLGVKAPVAPAAAPQAAAGAPADAPAPQPPDGTPVSTAGSPPPADPTA